VWQGVARVYLSRLRQKKKRKKERNSNRVCGTLPSFEKQFMSFSKRDSDLAGENKTLQENRPCGG